MESVAAWLETTSIAHAVGGSMWLIASLSAAHVIGFALVMGSALMVNLRWTGLLVPWLSVAEVTRTAGRGIAVGLTISILTGLLLVSWKAEAASANGIFQTKMLLLATAILFHFVWQRGLIRRQGAETVLVRVSGGIGLTLWLGLALAGCAFILLE